MECTPRLAQLCFSLAVLSSDLTRQIDTLTKRVGCDTKECLVLLPARQNIVDRKKDKEHHRAKWKVQMREIISDAVEFEELK